MSGGTSVSALPMTRPIFASDDWNWGYFVASFWEKLAISCAAFIRILIKDECAAVWRQRGYRDLGRNHVQAVLFQLHVADDVGTQRSGGVGQRGAAEAGMKFFGDGSATRLSATFQHQRLVSRFGQVESGDQAVMAATDDYDVAVVGFGHLGCPLEVFQDFESRQSSGTAHDAAAGMSGRSAHVQILDGSAELRPTRHRTQEEELLERKFALENIAFAQSELAFQIERRDYLACRMMSLILGAYSAMVLITLSPKASF